MSLQYTFTGIEALIKIEMLIDFCYIYIITDFKFIQGIDLIWWKRWLVGLHALPNPTQRKSVAKAPSPGQILQPWNKRCFVWIMQGKKKTQCTIHLKKIQLEIYKK